WAPDPNEIYRNNVDGTRTVLEACARACVERVVYTSSIGTLGLPKDGEPGTEATPVCLDDMIGPYRRSKFLAERVAEEYAARGLPVVIVNPSAPFGPWDVKPTPTGQLVLDYLRGRMYVSADKAGRELGLLQTPVEQALRDAVDWFVSHGYAPSPPA